ncbi:60S ribosome subunit biogenesis protein NIP7, partial [Eschrichtius robustus]|nr:60S ribosome subunit biogenesis protein NIP7 [Eschrichtius robustus]
MFEKIAKYIWENLQLLVDRPDGTYCFRMHNDQGYYVSEKILKLAANISGDKLVSLGTCFGKFTKTHKFRLHITALDYLAPYAKYKVWIKPGAEQSFLYGNHVLKSGLGRIAENTSRYQGVVVYSMADIPLGFGMAAKSIQDCRKANPERMAVKGIMVVAQFPALSVEGPSQTLFHTGPEPRKTKGLRLGSADVHLLKPDQRKQRINFNAELVPAQKLSLTTSL